MSVGRRGFLQAAAGFIGGTVGGVLLSPIPWKLTDDVAIWTQSDKGVPGLEDWAWRPSPEEGDISQVASICQLCDGGCGIKAELVSRERAISIKGNPQHAITRGGICPLGAAGLQFLYAPYRYQIPQPMKQTKERGDVTGFQPISWDEALGELSGVLSGLKGRPHSAACITGQSWSSMADLWKQFFAAYGSPNCFTMPSSNDSQKLAAKLMLGVEAPFAFALEEASLVLSFGSGLLEGWGSTGRMMAAYSGWQENKPFTAPTNFIQVESRCSMTASKADEWVPIRPGTEAALALGMIHVLIRDSLYDSYFVNNNVFGFETWVDRDDWKGVLGQRRMGFKELVMSQYAPDKVQEITGVPAETIERLTRTFARHKKPVAVWGRSDGNHPENVYHDMAFVILNAMVGNLKPDGLLSLSPEIPLSALPETPESQGEPRLDLAKFDKLEVPGNALYLFLEALNSDEPPYGIDLLMVHEANPLYSLPENQFFKEALAKVGKLVSFSSYMDETATQADLILPNHCALERYDDVKGLPQTPYAYYAVSKPVIQPQLDTRHTGDVLLAMAGQLGGAVKQALPWESYEAYLQQRVKGLAGKGAVADAPDVEPWKLRPGQSPKVNFKDEKDLWTKLTDGLFWYDGPVHVMNRVNTKSERVEFAVQKLLKEVDPAELEKEIIVPLCLRKKGTKVEMVPCEPLPPEPKPPEQADETFLPRYIPVTPSGKESEYPLWLVSYKLLYVASEYLPNPPFLNKVVWDTLLKNDEQFVEVNPQTAKEMGRKEGDWVNVSTPQMKAPVRARIHVTPRIPRDLVAVAEGFGHTAYDEFITGKGINANAMVEVQLDSLTGLARTWATRVKVSAA